MTIDNLTGGGSNLNTDGVRTDIITRTEDRLKDIDVINIVRALTRI